ncbi:hypothetical protein AB0K18_48200 [Nonomuraea sp. NPDC049421]|uniref:hypothetical protein n=1 Tax=Nonomuraea sp. NPDC049421 TaxID=3155275 RepID=UPI0034214D16
MEVFISWLGDANASRADIEDLIEDILGEQGEVTGGGEGDTGGNTDLEIFEDADTDRLMSEIVQAISDHLPMNASYVLADDEERHLLRDQLPGAPQVPMHLQAASEGICGGLNRALEAAARARGEAMPFKCLYGMVVGTTVVSQLAGRLPVQTVRERLESWVNGEAGAMIKQPLDLVGATAWEAHYNGSPLLRVPIP